MTGYDQAVLSVAVLAGGIATVSGFGIGSLLTPIFALKIGTGLAVAGVSVAHFLGTALRFWLWKRHINRKVLFTFGLTSATGGLLGALLHNVFGNEILTVIFGCLLVFAGISGLTGLSDQWVLNGPGAWFAGALSGVFGGLVGNQGGIRSAAMIGFGLKGKEFVATATAIALAVDVARLPVYVFSYGKNLFDIWPLVAIASAGVLIGTEIGVLMARNISEGLFKRIVSGFIMLVGLFIVISH
jgi:hypothetical protein